MVVSECSGELATAEQCSSGGVVRAAMVIIDGDANEMEVLDTAN